MPETMTAVELDENSFLGSYDGKFILTPYRRLTDDELLDVLFLSGFKNESEDINLPAAERNAGWRCGKERLPAEHGADLYEYVLRLREANGHWEEFPL
ncbi:MAG: hypothetical protein ACLUI3_08780 [Christensenellales bacterium]